ncbi:2-oxoglutarate receptor 1-like [Misgurnus anguillicaudatus]|uniref:2-oxoglutarate receptor 1-like n=1 Tax=Misgurnus anguillicaudatus TaxID=75329 RepID=UPI003CCF8525
MSQNSLNENCIHVDNLIKRYYLPVMYSIIFIVGTVGNITALVVYVFKVRPWTNTTIIMVNLLVSDLLLMVCLPFLVYYYTLNETWTLGLQMCHFTRFIFHFNLYGSILFLTCLSIFRYVVVVRISQKQNIKKKRWGVLACVLVWVVVVAMISPAFNKFELKLENNKTVCADLASTNKDFAWPYSWVLTVVGYLSPLIVVCLCYWRIMRTLGKGPHTGSEKRMKARRVIVLILTCFIVCFLPFHVLRALRIYTRIMPNVTCMLDHGTQAAYVISRPIAVLNIVFNMMLYTLSGDSFKQAFMDFFRCKQLTENTKEIFKVAVISKPSSDLCEISEITCSAKTQ